MYGQPPLDARVEVRLASDELALWRVEAGRRGLSVSELTRMAMANETRESEFQVLMRELRDLMLSHTRQKLPALVFDLTPDDELALLSATASEVGSEVMGKLTVEGPRAAFPRIYGARVRWGAACRQLHSQEPQDDL